MSAALGRRLSQYGGGHGDDATVAVQKSTVGQALGKKYPVRARMGGESAARTGIDSLAALIY